MTGVDRFRYNLPDEAIAQEPVEPRHDARLLDTRSLTDHRFIDLPRLLQPGDLVVVNRTRVRHARLRGVKSESGGAVEALLLRHLPDGHWEALVKPARRLRPGVDLVFGDLRATIVDGPRQGLAVLDLIAPGDLEEAIEQAGTVPLPPYITTELHDPGRYQTIFADRPGSAAASTAALHFTDEVVAGLSQRGIELATVELHVGLDTFRPIATESIDDHRMHSEWYDLPEETARAVEQARARDGRVVAIGTTTVRTLETRATDDGLVEPGTGTTELYLRPGSPIRVVDLLVTNFHLPGSSLLVLLEAFMGPGWREVYQAALQRGYRFLSFGDAMLCARSTRY